MRRANNKTSSGNMGISHPPQFQSTVRFNRKARYQANASGTLSLTRKMLLNHLVVGTTVAQVARILSGFRLKSVTIWSFNTSTSTSVQYTPTTASVEWTSSLGPSTIISDTSMSITPAFVQASPPLNSLASFWSLTGFNETEVLAILNYSLGSVIDITYECIVQNGETPVLVVPTNAIVVGTVYMSSLDGIAGAGQLPAVSYATTF